MPRTIHPDIPEKYAGDFKEAILVLNDSPKASAALSRRVLADLLEDYGHYKQFKVSARIDAFIDDTANPRHLRENLHYLREIADFAAHTQKDKTDGTIIDVEPGEAEWTLDVLERLFEYYIAEEKRSKEIRAKMDEKINHAGRKEIEPLAEDKPTE